MPDREVWALMMHAALGAVERGGTEKHQAERAARLADAALEELRKRWPKRGPEDED
jgi:hypothetical protein